MKKRSEIEERYKWDLTKFCANDEDFLLRLKNLENQISVFKQFEGNLSNDDILFSCLEKEMEFVKEMCFISLYADLKQCEDGSDRNANELVEKFSFVQTKIMNATAFIDVEVTEFSNEKLIELQKNEKFANYKRYFEGILKEKPHTLGKAEELLLTKLSEAMGGNSAVASMFRDVDLKFPDVLDEKGEKHQLNEAEYVLLIENPDRTLRKNAIKQMFQGYGNFYNTLGTNYINSVKEECVLAKIRKYKNALSEALFGEEISEDVYNLLISKVKENIDFLHEYYDEKRKMLGLEKFANYDVFAPCAKNFNKTFTYDEAIEVVKKAVAPLGEDYVTLIQRAKDERWIDVMPNENKANTSFSTSAYGATPVVFMHFVGNVESVFTLAHELGHAIHSYYSDHNQPIQTCDYTIFVAEIASITNEMLLLNYLLDNAENEEEKLYLYDYFLNSARATIFRQTMFAEFEQFVHEEYEKECPLTPDLLNEKYLELNQFYYGKNVEVVDETQYEWLRIPHFFKNFYVYKYATSMIGALKTSSMILSDKNYAEKYKKFLSAGCSADPITILKNADCDLSNPKTYDDAFDTCRKFLKKYKEKNV